MPLSLYDYSKLNTKAVWKNRKKKKKKFIQNILQMKKSWYIYSDQGQATELLLLDASRSRSRQQALMPRSIDQRYFLEWIATTCSCAHRFWKNDDDCFLIWNRSKTSSTYQSCRLLSASANLLLHSNTEILNVKNYYLSTLTIYE